MLLSAMWAIMVQVGTGFRKFLIHSGPDLPDDAGLAPYSELSGLRRLKSYKGIDPKVLDLPGTAAQRGEARLPPHLR
ncbi:hypothetical protein GALMADRAFT_243448 [Galerina marginata CBS 339.88]|uniref:Uncharacterized protein n=1 Tax=Galerina marginata (strain CBS 339.88) TaxID=685588 RepID=A0A067T8D9_GALM3|nr:hypothetical protein GALMADRAFT_243448 [Galerina marginata CBS 339.88]